MFRPLGSSQTLWHLAVAPLLSTRSSTRFLRSTSFCAALVAATFASVSTPANADTVLSNGGAKTAMPGGFVMMHGMRTAVVSATVSSGDVINAQRALVAANLAVARTRDFYSVPPSQVADALNSLTRRGGTDLRVPSDRRGLTPKSVPYGEPEPNVDTRSELDAQDYRALGKKLKAPRLMTVYVTPGDVTDTSATYSAVVETYNAVDGALVGRGEGTYTATLDAAATDAAAVEAPITSRPAIPAASGTPSIQTDVPAANGIARATTGEPLELPIRALGGAVLRAVQELNRPISLRGTVLSIPGAYQTRVSLSEFKGLRNGARVEYLEGGVPVAYGTVSSVGAGEAVVTVAPEASFSAIYVNMQVRNVNNPTLVRQGKTDTQLDEAEFRSFEKDFSVGLAVVGLAYLADRYLPRSSNNSPANNNPEPPLAFEP